MKKTITAVLALSVLAGSLASCRSADDQGSIGGRPVQARVEQEADRETDPEDDEEHSAADSYREFSFDLLNALCAESPDGQNFMVSPASLMLALQSVNIGARGTTRDEITDALFPGSTYEDGYGFSAVLNGILEGEYDNTAVSSCNSVWINDRITDAVNEEYLDQVREDLGASVNVVPFDADTPSVINDEIREQTNGMIDGIIDHIEPTDVMFLINTIAFEGAWLEEFPEGNDEEGIFVNSSGIEENVTYMNRNERLYIESDIATGFIKGYYGPYCFIAILPSDDSLSANEFAASFTSEDYMDLLASRTGDIDLDVTVPKFSFDSELTLDDCLQTLGIETAYDPFAADLTGIADLSELYISEVIQNTHIDLDEHGTSASAATSVCLDTLGLHIRSAHVELNRPFMFVIAETDTYTPVFIGTVNSIG
ncbi:MAG: serpin family protein [Clostridiales bacterium]|nr:serpin family protein [Clostridiales bacterium]